MGDTPAKGAWRRRVARMSKRTNPVVGPLLMRLPGFGVLEHTGRNSGNTYRTPIRLLGDPTTGVGYLTLTYGPDSDWFQNVAVNPGIFHGKTESFAVSAPELVDVDALDTDQIDLGDPVLQRRLRRILPGLGIEHLVRVAVTPTKLNDD